jgi:hypothetical protein
MKATCPNNPSHNRFVTVVHEMHEWVVDEKGDFIEDKECLEVTHDPDKDNTWTCYLCGAQAKVEDEKLADVMGRLGQ